MYDDLWAAFALYLILEGLPPALMPQRWRAAMRAMSEANPRTVRGIGLTIALLGAILLHLMG